MLHETALSIVLLLVTTRGTQSSAVEDASKSSLLESADEHSVLVADSLRHKNSSVYAKYAKAQNLTDNFTVGIAIAGKLPTSKCIISFKPKTNMTHRGVASIKRLAEHKVLLSTFDEFRAGGSKFVLTLLDLKYCGHRSLLSKYLPASHAIFTSEGLDIIVIVVISREFCAPYNTCILTFNHNNPYSEYRAFDIDLVREIRVEPLPAANNVQKFIVYGYNADNIYKMQIYNAANKIQELTAERPPVWLEGYDLVELPKLADSFNFEIYLCIISMSIILCVGVHGIFIRFKREKGMEYALNANI